MSEPCYFRQVQKLDRINLDRSPLINVKKMIRPWEITLALILKLTLVKSAQTLNSSGLQNRFSLNPGWFELILSNLCACPVISQELFLYY